MKTFGLALFVLLGNPVLSAQFLPPRTEGLYQLLDLESSEQVRKFNQRLTTSCGKYFRAPLGLTAPRGAHVVVYFEYRTKDGNGGLHRSWLPQDVLIPILDAKAKIPTVESLPYGWVIRINLQDYIRAGPCIGAAQNAPSA